MHGQKNIKTWKAVTGQLCCHTYGYYVNVKVRFTL